MMKRKSISILLILAMVMSMMLFVGCGSSKEEEEAPKPTNAQELLDAYKEAREDVDNYSMAGSGSAEVKAAAAGQEMTVPAEFDLTAELSDAVIHGNANASVTMYGEEEKVEGEAFFDIENKKVYSKTSEDSDWSTSDLDVDMDSVKEVKLPDSVKELLEFAEEDDAYVLTCDLTKVDIKDLIQSFADQQEDAGDISSTLDTIDQANIAIDSGTLTMKFAKDTCLLNSVKVEELSGSGAYEISEGYEMTVTVTAATDFTFSDYGSVSEDAFKLPVSED